MTFTGQFCIHSHLLYNIDADSRSCKAKESRSRWEAILLILYLVVLYLSGWNLTNLWVKQVCFTLVSNTKIRLRWHDETIKKIKKTNIIGVDKKLQTKIIVCLHVCLLVNDWAQGVGKWMLGANKENRGEKTAESRWVDLQWRCWQIYRQKIGCISGTILDFSQRKIWSLTSIQMVSDHRCSLVSHLAKRCHFSSTTQCLHWLCGFLVNTVWVTSFGWAATATY